MLDFEHCEMTAMMGRTRTVQVPLPRGTASRVPQIESLEEWAALLKLGMVVAGLSGQLADMSGMRLPIESVALQALVSEPIIPCMDVVVMANTVHGYMSQSDKGEMVIGGGTDGYNNYTQRGSFHHLSLIHI